MNVAGLGNRGALLGREVVALHRAHAERVLGWLPAKQPHRRLEHPPVRPQLDQQPFAEQRVAILAALGVLEAQQHPLAVDVAHLEPHRLADPQAGAIRRHEHRAVAAVRGGGD